MIGVSAHDDAVRLPSGAWHGFPVLLSEENRNVIESWTRMYRFSPKARN